MIDATYDALVSLDGRTVVAGFRDDMSDVIRWICYCRHNPPVKYHFYIRMVTLCVPLPKYSRFDEIEAVDSLPQEMANVFRPYLKCESFKTCINPA